ncbi:MAG TPA: flagellar basal body P-ring protein FlgI [Isosphaeraceae bacterium]|nr:flagellar basal body P-ring protein FlgI [Isosphaeraceae bacterium]
MRRVSAPLAMLVALVAAFATLAGAGPSRRKPNAPPVKPLKVDETIGDIALIQSASEIRVEGVGLVVGLDGTGSAPAPSFYRQKLLDQMRKAGVEAPDKILDSPEKWCSLVIVKARIPAGVTTKDKIDVEVELPPDSSTTSLAGGWLMTARLNETFVSKKGDALETELLAAAGGPVLVGSKAKPDDGKVGRVLGGCRSKKDMPFAIEIDDHHRSARTTARVQAVINQRFHQHEGVDQAGLANAKTDVYLTIKVPHVYHHNQARYFRVLKLLPLVSTPQLQAERIERWGKELLDPKTAGVAAMRLEGLGPNGAQVLKLGLESKNAQVRFFAAEALAYLDDVAGVDVLADTAVTLPKFRALALAALAAMDEPAAKMRLRKLLDHTEVVVRYGAFNALRTQDENDPFLGRVTILDQEEPDDEHESMQMKIATHRRRKDRPVDPFSLYVVDSEGPPLVHVTGSHRCEIVVFGKDQKLLTPVVLGGGGTILLNAADGDNVIQITRITSSGLDRADTRVQSSPALGEVIKETTRLGATYPEIVRMLSAAERQKNLSGALVVDALPQVDPDYDSALLAGVDLTAPKKDDSLQKTKKAEEPKRKRFLDLFHFNRQHE